MFGHRPIVSSLRGIVAAAHPQAAFVGARVLRDGGNAFDAAAATAAALNVVEPFMSGLAGLGAATCYVANERRVRCLDFTPGAPRDLDVGGLAKTDIFKGPCASAVPGSLAGWAALVERYGRRTLASALEPAIELAAEGFPLTDGIPTITGQWWDLRHLEPEWRRVYTDGSATMSPGQVLRQPDLARTLTAIAEHGPGYLYEGPLGEAMTTHLRSRGGALSRADLAGVKPLWVEPLAVDYRGYRVHSLPPPAESFQFLLTLAILDAVDLAGRPRNGSAHLDAVMRAIRLAGEVRITRNGRDAAAAGALLQGTPLADLRERHAAGEGLVGRVQQWRAITDPDLLAQREYTTSFSIGDADGNLVCLTQSLGSIYGSGVVIPGTGVCMNNFLNWTDLEPDSPNHLRAGEPIAMCLAPSVTLDRTGTEPWLALGTPGSYGILQTQAQAMLQHLDYGLSLQQAIEAPRFRLFDGNLARCESRIDPATIVELQALGHEASAVEPWTMKVGGMQAVARDPGTGVLTGAADPRRDGYVAAA